jgi:hypothetical protein
MARAPRDGLGPVVTPRVVPDVGMGVARIQINAAHAAPAVPPGEHRDQQQAIVTNNRRQDPNIHAFVQQTLTTPN